MNPFKWFRRKRMRYYKAMMLLTQEEYLHAKDSDFSKKYQMYLTYSGKYERLARRCK